MSQIVFKVIEELSMYFCMFTNPIMYFSRHVAASRYLQRYPKVFLPYLSETHSFILCKQSLQIIKASNFLTHSFFSIENTIFKSFTDKVRETDLRHSDPSPFSRTDPKGS